MFVERVLKLDQLIEKKSHFLFGPRGTGKSSLIQRSWPSDGIVMIDLLSEDLFGRLLRKPSLLGELVPSGQSLVVIDEVQRIPALLNEVHKLIEGRKLKFLLTGSSARKLRRGGANLLGGRAWEARLFPLTRFELKTKFDLIRYLNHGGLPSIYFSDHAPEELRNYVGLYLKEEIQAESLVKRLDHFARFLDTAGIANAEEINYEAVASDAGVPARTVAGYFEILEDTLIGFQLRPYLKTRRRKAIKRSKFYFFDVGVAGALARRGRVEEGSESFGRAFEHFILQEIRAFLAYSGSDRELCYWRSTTQYEVDLIVGDELAIEVKATERVSDRHLSGLKALAEEKRIRNLVVVSRDPLARESGGIELLPWQDFLDGLWAGRWLGQ